MMDDTELPTPTQPYPEGDVVGPCVCGSWPGGPCLRCKLTPPTPPADARVTDEMVEAANAAMARVLFNDGGPTLLVKDLRNVAMRAALTAALEGR
jgi:hypothetical protein